MAVRFLLVEISTTVTQPRIFRHGTSTAKSDVNGKDLKTIFLLIARSHPNEFVSYIYHQYFRMSSANEKGTYH